LQQASGRVQCGGCNRAFNAVDYLSENPPAAGTPMDSATNQPLTAVSTAADEDEIASGDADLTTGDVENERSFEERNSELLKALDDLAGPEEIRIEDTGVEWRVLEKNEDADLEDKAESSGTSDWYFDDEEKDLAAAGNNAADDVAAPAGSQTALEFGHVAAEEQRYDDSTPLPDDFEEEAFADTSSPAFQPPPSSQGDAEPADELPVLEDAQVDLALGDPDEWLALLDDVLEQPSDNPDVSDIPAESMQRNLIDDTGNAALRMEAEEELSAIHSELSATLDPFADTAGRDTNDDAPRPLDETANPDDGTALRDEATDREPDITDEDMSDRWDNIAHENEASETAVDPEIKGEEAETEDDSEIEDEKAETVDDPELEDGEAETADDPELEDGEAETVDDPELEDGEAETADDPETEDEEAKTADDPETEDEEAKTADDPETEDDLTGENEDAEAETVLADDEYGSTDEEASVDADDFRSQIALIEDSLNDDPDRDESAQENTPADEEVSNESGGKIGELDIEKELAASSGSESATADAVRLEHTVNVQMREDMRRAMEDKDFAAAMTGADGSPLIETIIMEGDFVHGAINIETDEGDSKIPDDLDEPKSLADTYVLSRSRKSSSRLSSASGPAAIAGVIILSLLLAGQYVHKSREYLATFGLFEQTIGPVYRLLGRPVTPAWDIKGWQFETTNGSTDEKGQVLTIYSTIANRSTQALPYPLVHVSLKDRWEEIIGSRVLEPNEYLAGNSDPRRPVAAGEKFTAVISIATPSDEVTGFLLEVCYRVDPAILRCANEDFKN